MRNDSPALLAKKARLRHLVRVSWQFQRHEPLSRSQALRKAWVLATALGSNQQWAPNLIDPTLIDVAGKGGFVGGIKLLHDGFVSGRNCFNQSQIFRCRHQALSFALGREKVAPAGQLPLL